MKKVHALLLVAAIMAALCLVSCKPSNQLLKPKLAVFNPAQKTDTLRAALLITRGNGFPQTVVGYLLKQDTCRPFTFLTKNLKPFPRKIQVWDYTSAGL